MIKTKIKVEAPGKLILLGEYAVLEKAPSLVTAVDKYCRVQITPGNNSFFHFTAPNLGLNNISFKLDDLGNPLFTESENGKSYQNLRFVFAILKHITTRIDHKIKSADIHIDTKDFYHQKTKQKLGIGSSAALTVAFLQALAKHIGEELWPDGLFPEALKVHRIAQGELGSGVDIAASTTGGVIQYRMPELKQGVSCEITKLKWPEKLKIIPIWTGTSASTRSFVQTVNRFREAAPGAYGRVMKKMTNLCEEGCKAFRSGDISGFMEIIPAFADLERILGNSSGTSIISDIHRKLTHLISQAGGVYKPSGAGGGDIGVAFCSNDNTFQRILADIEKSPFEILDLSIQRAGIQTN